MEKQDNQSCFHFNSLKIYTTQEVYEPAEDTFLLLETLTIHKDQKILELGTGTGIIALYCAQQGANVICSDINPHAIDLCNMNIQENRHQISGSIEVRKSDLFEKIESNERFDIIIFNPPYLPTTPKQKKGISYWYAHSFDGGLGGLDVTMNFLEQLKTFLKKEGAAYFISSSYASSYQLNKLLNTLSYTHIIFRQLRCDDEILTLHRISI